MDDQSGDWLTYGELARLAEEWATRMPGPKGLVFLYAKNDIDSVAALLGGIAAGHAVALFDKDLTSDVRAALEAKYRPAWVSGQRPGGLIRRSGDGPLNADVAVLLSTSGSTGSAKLVKLTLPALAANAAGISEVLGIRSDDVAAGYLPLHYSYGLSVLTSHLVRGARIRLTSLGLTDREFWPAMRNAAITHMPGVPFHYQIMLKLGLRRLHIPSLRVMTQAGGGLDAESRKQVHDFMSQSGGQFFVMYGQTEAAPRMTTLQHDDFLAAPQSSGIALPDCRIEIWDADETGRGEVVFYGPNVMMGYAESREDLGLADEMGGRLPTGDIGFLDSAGRLTLTGRSKRAGKVFGLRVNLDEIESFTNTICASAVTQSRESLTIHIVSRGGDDSDEDIKSVMLSRLQERFTLPLASYDFHFLAAIPRTERGKVDYLALGRLE